MTHFADLSEFTYGHAETTPLLNVGWLDGADPFPTGETSETFRRNLAWLCATRTVNLTRGWHTCTVCPRERGARFVVRSGKTEHWTGSAEIRVAGEGLTYAAPDSVIHYVIDHDYRPPDGFVAAVEGLADAAIPSRWRLVRKPLPGGYFGAKPWWRFW